MKPTNLKIIDSTWFTSVLGIIGIIKCKDTITCETKYFMGTASGSDTTELEDAERIVALGNKLNYNQMKNIFA